jgi:hypothetical protein
MEENVIKKLTNYKERNIENYLNEIQKEINDVKKLNR